MRVIYCTKIYQESTKDELHIIIENGAGKEVRIYRGKEEI